jgi:hypothetical protein
MATITVTVPDTLTLGRNGSIGTLPIEWSRVPQTVLDHMASVYFSQYITDAANAGGRTADQSARMARAQKKLDNMYAGRVTRPHGDGVRALSPIELEAAALAKTALVKTAKQSSAWSAVPKSLRKRDDGIVHALNASSTEQRSMTEWIAHTLTLNPGIMKSAERNVRERNGAIKL